MIWYILKSIVKIFYLPIKLSLHQYKWRKINNHNKTYPIMIFPINKVKIGNFTYGPLEIYSWNNNNEYLQIGHFCSIAYGVKFLLGGNHEMKILSTYPFLFFFRNEDEATTKGSIIIEDDVWIGMDAIILSGVTIGKGSIIATRSVVTKSFPPYSIIGGNPAKVINKRFEQETIDKLLEIDFKNIDENFILENLEKLYDTNYLSTMIEKLRDNN